MEDLTTLHLGDLKKNVFELCHKLHPDHAQYEDDKISHIYHAIKVTKVTEDFYTVVDMSKDKPSEISNKFLLYMMLEQLNKDIEWEEFLAQEEIELEGLADSLLNSSGEPDQHEIEVAEEILRESTRIEEETN